MCDNSMDNCLISNYVYWNSHEQTHIHHSLNGSVNWWMIKLSFHMQHFFLVFFFSSQFKHDYSLAIPSTMQSPIYTNTHARYLFFLSAVCSSCLSILLKLHSTLFSSSESDSNWANFSLRMSTCMRLKESKSACAYSLHYNIHLYTAI